ncbi:unnamed protein product [Lathyrus sativus]|nr:unnamed protein product [Lathyrus sativus]
MVGSNSVGSSSTPSVEFPSLPRCGCDRVMKMWIANTVQNRNRKFWRCRNTGNGNSSDLFVWDDEIGDCMNGNSSGLFVWDDEIGDCVNENSNIQASFQNFEMENVKFEITAKKLEKAKMKIEVQKKKYFNLKMAFMMSWFIFAMLYKLL